jgi:hypothetical protein
MKIYTKLVFLLFLVYEINLFPQIPNSEFENWVEGDSFTPEGWLTNNAPPTYTPLSRTTEAYMGSYAIQLGIGNSIIGPIPPYLVTSPFPVTEAYGSMMGYYQFFQNTSTEVLFIQTWFMDNGQLVGGGLIDIGSPTSTYTQFSINIEYGSGSFNDVPDSAYISPLRRYNSILLLRELMLMLMGLALVLRAMSKKSL